jgi:molecular chaperone DnaK (HSP70)
MENISKKKDIQIHSVEAVGGAFRIPAVQKIICDTFKVKNIFTTVNASEAVAKGAAMMSAMHHPTFRVAEYGVEEANIYPINVSWTFFKPG